MVELLPLFPFVVAILVLEGALFHLLLVLFELLFDLSDELEVNLALDIDGLSCWMLHEALVLGGERDGVVPPKLHILHFLTEAEDFRLLHEGFEGRLVCAIMSDVGKDPLTEDRLGLLIMGDTLNMGQVVLPKIHVLIFKNHLILFLLFLISLIALPMLRIGITDVILGDLSLRR